MGNTIFLETPGGSLPIYVAKPAAKANAAIVVIQEIFGVNAGIRHKCEALAEAGYIALAPDLFWRIEPGIELDPDIPAELDRALAILNQFDIDRGIEDIAATIVEARRELGADDAKVGAVGYCAGGRFAFLTAARTDVDATVSYYGGGIETNLDEANGVSRPLMLHYGTADRFIPASAVALTREALASKPDVEIYEYDGADHGFATEFGERRKPDAAALADQRTANFFAVHLA